MKNEMTGQVPSFLVIGAMKSGTTSLHSYLDRHPDISMSDVKEIDYFTLHFDKGLSWYKNHFRTDAIACGESSQNYTKRHMDMYSGCAERIHAGFPDIKMIYIVRDPVKRLISENVQNISGGDDDRSLKDIFSGKSKEELLEIYMIGTSRYYFQLQEYLQYFAKEQIHVVCFEELVKNRLHVMNEIFDFVGVHQVNDDSVFDYQLNSGNEKYKTSGISHALNRNKFSRTLKGMLPAVIIEKLKANALVQELLRKKMEKETVPEDALPLIMEILTEDANKLRELTGKSFSEWSV